MLNQSVGTAREWYLAEILVSLYLLQVRTRVLTYKVNISGISTCMSHLCLAALTRPAAFVAQFQSITDDARHSRVTLTGKFILSEVGKNAFLNFPQDIPPWPLSWQTDYGISEALTK